MLITLRLRDLPSSFCGTTFGGLQLGKIPAQIQPLAPEMKFSVEVRVVEVDGAADFRGPWVQGRRGERFGYITWGRNPSETDFDMYRRAKIMLDEIPADLLAEPAVTATVEGTSPDGGPVCARVRPDHIHWSTS